MRIRGHSEAKRRRQSGQILPLFALWIVVLIPFVGLSIDLGFAYITKAQLSKAVDAAALAGISNYALGQATAQSIATSTFNANFAPTGSLASRYVAMPVPAITFPTDAYGNQSIQVKATATIRTFFVRALSAIGGANWATLAVADTGQAQRSKVIMTLVLDRSGSMDPNLQNGFCTGGCGTTQGGEYLPTAVANFISVFEDNIDEAAMVSFASTAITNVAMETPFKHDITTAANNLVWSGGTFSHGGLTNALAINNGVTVATGVNAIKVVVFFTDGQSNMIQNNLACPTLSQTLNFGGFLTNTDPVAFWLPNDATNHIGQLCAQYITASDNYCCGGDSCTIPVGCDGLTFPSINGGSKAVNVTNIVAESEARCIAVANQMRANGMYVYSIGLSDGTIDSPDQTFLEKVANDPALQETDPSAFEANLPPGQAVITGNGANLNQLFQQIAGDILLRLTY